MQSNGCSVPRFQCIVVNLSLFQISSSMTLFSLSIPLPELYACISKVAANRICVSSVSVPVCHAPACTAQQVKAHACVLLQVYFCVSVLQLSVDSDTSLSRVLDHLMTAANSTCFYLVFINSVSDRSAFGP